MGAHLAPNALVKSYGPLDVDYEGAVARLFHWMDGRREGTPVHRVSVTGGEKPKRVANNVLDRLSWLCSRHRGCVRSLLLCPDAHR